jgi:hypothetical protein
MSRRLTPAERQLREAMRAIRSARGNKFHAQKTERDGLLFDSGKEADRYRELTLLQAGGKISGLECQAPWDLVVNGIRVCGYVADFQYFERPSGALVVEDAKGYRTPMYKLKRALMLACHGITIKET